MGYIILGIIILLLLTIFMTDLYRSYKDRGDETYRAYRGQPYHSEFGEDFDYDIDDENEIDREMDIYSGMGANNSIYPNQINPYMNEFSDDLEDPRFDVLDDEIDEFEDEDENK